MRKPWSFISESITASGGGKERDGAVGRPILRAVAVSTVRGGLATAAVSRAPPCGAAAGGREGGGGGGGGFWARSDPMPSMIRTIVAAATRRARRRLATHAHQMLSSYRSNSGPSISIIDTASGGVRIAARKAAITIA